MYQEVSHLILRIALPRKGIPIFRDKEMETKTVWAACVAVAREKVEGLIQNPFGSKADALVCSL